MVGSVGYDPPRRHVREMRRKDKEGRRKQGKGNGKLGSETGVPYDDDFRLMNVWNKSFSVCSICKAFEAIVLRVLQV